MQFALCRRFKNTPDERRTPSPCLPWMTAKNRIIETEKKITQPFSHREVGKNRECDRENEDFTYKNRVRMCASVCAQRLLPTCNICLLLPSAHHPNTSKHTFTITSERGKECIVCCTQRAKYKNISLNFYVAKKADRRRYTLHI